MTGREALFASLTLSPKQALYESVHNESAVMRLVCKWKLEEPAAYHEIIEAAGIAAVVDTTPPKYTRSFASFGTVSESLSSFFRHWHTYGEACHRLGGSYASIKQQLAVLKRNGWTVERRRRNPHIPGLEYRAVPPREKDEELAA